MPWPNDVVTRIVTGTYLTSQGNAAVGRVTFTPTTSVHDTNDALVVEDTITVVLNANGGFSLALPTTDNPLLSPTGWAYEVNVRLHGVKPKKFNVTLPAGDGTPVSIINNFSAAQVTPVINEVVSTPLQDHVGTPGGTFNDVVTRTVVGTYLTGVGNPADGRVTFTPTARIVDANDAVIVEGTLTAPLDATGSFEIDLPTTDNPLLYPAGWAYQVHVRIQGIKPQKFFAFLPLGNGSSVDLNQQLSGSGSVGDATVPTSVRGPIGPRGAGTIVGSGPPTYLVGQNGDIYIDTVTGSYYGPKLDGEWSGVPFFIPQQPDNTTQRKVFTQSSASSTWSITHTLGGRPSVTIVDSAGTVVLGDIVYNSDTAVTISFTAPFSGYAYLT